ncbi:GNAT family N-acetyltransferase [Knoellia koreensis]|uniref:GNAT family N-acetyltransferase n=1 Tax=Knoellia koreensis TaxID=2730921 RepID=A0A849H959_9MICO|nr:GNAT family N-acetyltransferase [Knoellia sp. DB2414S]NNM46276.1 GNAT family N-acetyltransferase [Knoellia sp. DB2414S]
MTITETVTVRPLAVDDDEELAEAQRVMRDSALLGRPWGKVPSLREFTIDMRKPSSSERLEPYVAVLEGQVAGLLLMWFPLHDNTKFTWFDLHVDPLLRQRGVGSALAEKAVERTRADGRTTALVEFHVPDDNREDHEYARFARRHGFTYANTEIRRILDLPVDPALLQGFADEAAERHEGYRIETHVGGLPEELRQSYCDCFNQLAVDAPTGEIDFEEESLTPQTYAEELGRMAEQGRTPITTVAIDPSGAVVAYNDLVTRAEEPAEVMQWGTLVRREHRGHRLGMAVKARGLQELARIAPDAKRVQTCNAEQNAHMVGVNEDLGFRRVEALLAYQRKLDA